MGSLLLIALFLPFAAVPLVALLGPRLGPRTGWLALAVPVSVAKKTRMRINDNTYNYNRNNNERDIFKT
jgi:hypothetical protein